LAVEKEVWMQNAKELIDRLDEATYNLWFAARRFYWITERLGKDLDPERVREYIRKAETFFDEMYAYADTLDPDRSFEEEGDEVDWYHYD
jgi:hypothetical protein